MTSPKTIKKLKDHVHKNSAKSLKREIKLNITTVFAGFLKLVELRWGRQFEGFEEVRGEILRLGNNAIRRTEEVIDKKYNVQKIPEFTAVNVNKIPKATEESNE